MWEILNVEAKSMIKTKKKKKVVPGRKLLAIVNQDKEEKKANLSACN